MEMLVELLIEQIHLLNSILHSGVINLLIGLIGYITVEPFVHLILELHVCIVVIDYGFKDLMF